MSAKAAISRAFSSPISGRSMTVIRLKDSLLRFWASALRISGSRRKAYTLLGVLAVPAHLLMVELFEVVLEVPRDGVIDSA
jgi:hypothetical protein